MARDTGRSPSAPRAALAEYRKKRDFSRTPEPEGGSAGGGRGDRAFVIQKHAATRLHYDFRLELEGTLKSWAVPKGPSLDPLERRLAMHVEDHPIEYGGFEGIIPKGEYGGGTVLLWDRGTWEPEEDPHKGYHAGSLKFTLHGEKLNGSWALVRIHDKRQTRDAGKSWLLIKHRDAEARPAKELSIVEARPESVATGRSMEEIAAAGDRVWHSKGGGEAKTASEPAAGATGRRAATVRKPRAPVLAAGRAGRAARPPAEVRPAPACDRRRQGAGGRGVAARAEVRRLPHPRSSRGRAGAADEPQRARLDGEVSRRGRGRGALARFHRDAGRRGGRLPARRHDQLPGAPERGVRRRHRRSAHLRGLRPPPSGRLGRDRRPPRGQKGAARAAPEGVPGSIRSSTAITWPAPAPSSSPRRAGSASRASSRSGATRSITAPGQRTGSRSSASASRRS